MGPLAAVNGDEAVRFARVVDSDRQLPAARLAPSSGGRPVDLGSLAEVEEFLVPMTAEDIIAGGMQGSINHVDPALLASWVRETIGDLELADGLDELVESGKPFGVLVPAMKSLLAERLAQCEAAQSQE